MADHEQFDPLLDAALRTYGPPREGLENRILATLAEERTSAPAQPERPHTRWIGWAIAMPIAAALLLLSLTLRITPPWHADPPTKPSLSTSTAPGSKASPQILDTHSMPSRVQLASVHHHLRRRVPKPNSLPKLDMFPSPQPPTSSEQRFAAYAATAPPEEREALIEGQQKQDQPIHITAIEIAPLDSSTSHGN